MDSLLNARVSLDIQDRVRDLFKNNDPTPPKAKRIQIRKPKTILIADAFLAAAEIKRLRFSEEVAPYAISGLWLADAFLGKYGQAVQNYMYRMVEIALGHNDSITKVEIVLSRVELSCKPNSLHDLGLIEKRIREIAGDRQLVIEARLDESSIDFAQYTDVLFHCMDYRWTKRNAKDFKAKGRNPVIFGFAGSGAVLLSRLGAEIQAYAIEQIAFVHKLLGIKNITVVNHGDRCGGYEECGKSDSSALNDLAKVKAFLADVFAQLGIYGIESSIIYKTEYKAYYDMEKGVVTE